jgi:hypothetical protein
MGASCVMVSQKNSKPLARGRPAIRHGVDLHGLSGLGTVPLLACPLSVTSASEPKFMELPQQTCKRLVIGHRLATDRAKIGRKGSYANAHIG